LFADALTQTLQYRKTAQPPQSNLRIHHTHIVPQKLAHNCDIQETIESSEKADMARLSFEIMTGITIPRSIKPIDLYNINLAMDKTTKKL
jgi:hypothetical protein